MGDFPLKLDPSERIVFSSEKLGEEEVKVPFKLNNTSGEKLCWKLKCTSNELFRIRPVTGKVLIPLVVGREHRLLSYEVFLKPKDEVVVTLVFSGGKSVPESGKHYFAIYTIKAMDDKNAREQWSSYKGTPQGQKKLPVDFKKQTDKPDAAADKKDADEKDEDKKVSSNPEIVRFLASVFRSVYKPLAFQADEKKVEEKKESKNEEKKEEKKESKKEEKKVVEDKKAKEKADVKVDVKIEAKVGDEKKGGEGGESMNSVHSQVCFQAKEEEKKVEEKKDEKKEGSKKEAEKDDDKKGGISDFRGY
ncbi:Major sperm protein [Aphelenchoides besseyi]|nr:Major sperm protein [Aphelenchoides besseyi]